MARSIISAIAQIKSEVAELVSPRLIRTVCETIGHVWRRPDSIRSPRCICFCCRCSTAIRRVRKCPAWAGSPSAAKRIARHENACRCGSCGP